MKKPEKGCFRVIVAGTRTFANYPLLCSRCDGLLVNKKITHRIVIVSGTAMGADTLGERYAHEHGYDLRRFPADWATHGRSAGIKRNITMSDNADALIAFWDGQSRGTAHMIKTAKEKGLLVRVIQYEGNIQET